MEQMSMEERDFLLWRYLHKDLSILEEKQVIAMIDSSDEWAQALQILEAEEKSFAQLELEQPSIRFSKNVMDAIGQLPIAPSVRSYIDIKLMKWIGGSMIGIVLVFLIYTFAIIPWNLSNNTHTGIDFKLPSLTINTQVFNNSYWLYGAGLIVTFCAFYFYSKSREIKHRWE